MRSLCGLCLLVLSVFAGFAAATDVEALIDRGEAQLRTGDPAGAARSLEQAAATDPGSFRARLRLAGAYLMSQRYADSIPQFQAAIALEPDNSAAFAGLGVAYLHSGQYGPAREALRRAARLDPSKEADIAPLLERIEQRIGSHTR